MAIQVVFMPPPPPPFIMVPVRYRPPPYIHNVLLQRQQERYYHNERQEFLPNHNNVTKSRWMSSGNNNFLKLNTDGSSKGNPGPSSFGGLIRDANGRWLCGYMGKMKGKLCTSLEAEIWSIFKGLCLIKEKNLSNILIETDCETIVRLGPGSIDKSHPLKSVMDDIEKMKIEQKCTVVHTRRDGNQCADLLAKFGGRQSDEYIVLEKPPALLLPYLVRDKESAAEFERNRQQ